MIAWVESSCSSDCGKVWRDVGYCHRIHSPPPPPPQTIPQSLEQLLATQAITHLQSGIFNQCENNRTHSDKLGVYKNTGKDPGEQGWRSGESARLPPKWPGFDSRSRRHMWVEFVVGSRPCSERFFSGYSGFPLSSKTNISKFQFDLESVPN